jgi:hypothetical protein
VLFPGATRVLGIYYCKESLEIKSIERDLTDENNSITKEIDFLEFEKFRNQRPRYSWINIPSSISSIADKQLKIQGEYKNHCLLIRFANQHDKLNDLLIIYFKNEEHVFRISDKKQKLGTDLKQSLASVYIRSLDVIKQQIEDDQAIDRLINTHKAILDESKISREKELNDIKKKQRLLIHSIIENKTRNLNVENAFSFEWDKSALNYLAEHVTDLLEIEKIIKRALIIGINENENNSKTIRIYESHVKTRRLETKVEEHVIADRYQRTKAILDRYEDAAATVLKNKMSPTGSNLGASLNPSITASAISDAIRKHGSKISHLLREYPQRWSILRNNFKPIQNKLYSRDSLDQIAS